MSIIRAEEISKKFGDQYAVRDVSFTLPAGEILVLLGPNGAGKTTIIRLLSAIFKPDKGYAEIAGFDTVKNAEEVRRLCGVLTEHSSLYPRMSLYEYLEFFGKLYQIHSSSLQIRISDLAEKFGMLEELDISVESFSKGTKQKASLMRALLHNPPVLFFDEPTSALDPAASHKVRNYILGLKEEGKTIIVCTHNLTEAEYLADKICIIKKGAIIFWGTLSSLKKRLKEKQSFKLIYKTSKDLGKNLEEIFNQFIEKQNIPAKIVYSNQQEVVFETEDEIKNSDVLHYLISAGFKIISCERISQSLEDAYLKLQEEER